MDLNDASCNRPATGDHRRQWRDCLYVYPVISRRSEGLSIGVNLNPDKRCNFACLYCQVDRHIRRDLHVVDLAILGRELRLAVSEAITGRLWDEGRFPSAGPEMRRLNDIAFSGDGEPTCLANFDQAVEVAAQVKGELGADDLKIVVITNASNFDSPQFTRALEILDANNGEIWAKLDAGTDEFFHRVNRPQPSIPLASILANITEVARGREIVIQTLLLKIDGAAPTAEEIEAYCLALREILQAGGKIKLVQLHTIARAPLEPCASALSDAELDSLARQVRSAVVGPPVRTYYGADVEPQAK